MIKVTGRIKQAEAIMNIKIIRGKQNRNNSKKIEHLESKLQVITFCINKEYYSKYVYPVSVTYF